jgi:16S rRNA (cytosine1402-N4)-methyltransferase
METVHKPVMFEEAIAGLNLKKGLVVVDATLGGGGHSLEILKNILPGGILIAIDRDAVAIERFKNKIKKENLNIKDENLILVKDNFANIKNILRENKIDRVDAVLADFGLSSDQLDDNERGFSFNSNSQLDMRMDKDQELSAYEVVNNYSEGELNKIFREFGEEKFARKIVKKIIEVRAIQKIQKMNELVDIILNSVPEKYKHQRIHPATRTLQAIRMEVNQELESIAEFVKDVLYKISTGGRLVVISFHSGEDRLVKNIFKKMAINCECPPEFPVCRCSKRSQIKFISKKPITATEIEIEKNPRARSAKLRIVEKI